jgi:hypothetical protein
MDFFLNYTLLLHDDKQLNSTKLTNKGTELIKVQNLIY